MKTADDILKMIQFDLKHHRRLSEDSLEAISQFKADGIEKEHREHVNALRREINMMADSIQELMQERDSALEKLNKAPSSLKPISESKGETGEIEKEIRKQLRFFARDYIEGRGIYEDLVCDYAKEISSLRSSEPERAGNDVFEDKILNAIARHDNAIQRASSEEDKSKEGLISYTLKLVLQEHRKLKPASPPLKALSEIEISDEEIEQAFNEQSISGVAPPVKIEGAKWYREELKKRLNPVPEVKEKGDSND